MSVDVKMLDEKVEYSKRQMETFCNSRKEAIAQYVGVHYSDNGADKTVPTNLIELAVTIYQRLLAARAPRCLVTTDIPELKPFAYDMEIVLNQLPKEIDLQNTIQMAVKEAMFGIGVVKIGIAGCDERKNIGDEPFVSLVQLDDYFVDMSARSWNEVQYEGNEYWMDVETIRQFFGEDIAPDNYNGESVTGNEQANAISSNEVRNPLHERVLLRDVYLVKENELVTYAVNSKKELRRIKWDGPEGTPYVKLWFSGVPGNLLPLPPISVWKDLHDVANFLFRKLSDQARKKKTIAGVVGGSDEEVMRIKDANDGSAVRVSGANVQNMNIGGIDNGNLAFFLQTRDLFSMLAGNLDSLGGLSPQAETAMQDKLISEAASARIKDMGDRTIDFARNIFKRLAWYVWTDPVRERKYRKVFDEKFNFGVNKVWTPGTRDGDFLDYNFDIAVFSMQDDSPSARLQKLANIFNTFFMPLQQVMMQQGVTIDVRALAEHIGRNANLPELKNFIVVAGEPPMTEGGGRVAGNPRPSYVSTKSPVTHRVYERVNRPGSMSERGKSAVLQQVLLGGKPQSADMAGLSLGRVQ